MENNRISPENKINGSNKPIQTDSAEIVRRHLEDENHQITEDDIRNVKIVITDDEPITIGAEATALLVDDESKSTDEENDEAAHNTDPRAKPGNPWDVLNE